MFPFFIEKNLISKNQLGFKPRYYCVNQLLVITHDLFSRFDNGYVVERYSLAFQKLIINKVTKVVCQVHFYSYYALIIYLVISNVILSYSLMKPPCFTLLQRPKQQLLN